MLLRCVDKSPIPVMPDEQVQLVLYHVSELLLYLTAPIVSGLEQEPGL